MTSVRAVLVVLGMTALASAQKPEVTREFQAGVDAFRLGKYDEARTRLEKARAMAPKLAGPNRFLAAVAQAQSRWDDCIAAARTALALNPVSRELADTRKLHEDCRVSAGRAPNRGELGDGAAIAVTTNVPGATVRIAGLTYGGTPLAPRPITVGRLAVEIEKAGWKRAQREVETLAGVVTDVIVELEPGAETTATAIKPRTGWLVVPRGARIEVDGEAVVVPEDGRIAVMPGVRVVEARAPGKDPWRRRVAITAEREMTISPVFVETAPRESRRRLGFALAGTGLGLGAAGIAAYLVSRDATNEARDIVRVETARLPGDPDPAVRTRADFEAARTSAERWRTVSNLAYGGAIVAGGIGAYLLIRGRAPAADDAPPFAVAPVTGGAVISRSVSW